MGRMPREGLAGLEAVLNGRGTAAELPDLTQLSSGQLERLEAWPSNVVERMGKMLKDEICEEIYRLSYVSM